MHATSIVVQVVLRKDRGFGKRGALRNAEERRGRGVFFSKKDKKGVKTSYAGEEQGEVHYFLWTDSVGVKEGNISIPTGGKVVPRRGRLSLLPV